MPEDLARLVLLDLTRIGPMERTYLHIHSYCGQFDADIHGPVRSFEQRAQAKHTPMQALVTESGALAVEELLIGIEHGMFA